MEELSGTQAFRLGDIEVDEDAVLAGKTTNGSAGWGRVIRILPGIGFEVDNGTQRSVLWSQFWRVEPTRQQLVRTTRPATDLRRTDSGADYGWPGYPDCAWWESQGVMYPPFVAVPAGTPPDRILELLREAEPDLEAEGPFRRAWSRQLAAVENPVLRAMAAPALPEWGGCSLYTPPSSPSSPPPPSHPSCEVGRGSLLELLPAPVDTSAEEYRGRGIGGFRMPSQEGKTQREFRAALLPEIRRWLTEELPRQAKAASLVLGGESQVAEIAEGTWPGARLFQLTVATEKAGIQWPWPSADFNDRYYACALWAADVCEKFLTGSCFIYAPAAAALDFLRVDRLEDGQTLLDLWNWTRFGPLRDAPPLSESESEEGSEEEEDAEWGGELSFSLGKSDEGEMLVRMEGSLTVPVWVVAAVGGVVLTYLWMVGYLLGRR